MGPNPSNCGIVQTYKSQSISRGGEDWLKRKKEKEYEKKITKQQTTQTKYQDINLHPLMDHNEKPRLAQPTASARSSLVQELMTTGSPLFRRESVPCPADYGNRTSVVPSDAPMKQCKHSSRSYLWRALQFSTLGSCLL